MHAGSMPLFERSFRDIADYVEIPRRQNPKANDFKLVHDWLRDRKSGHWLLVLENVDDNLFLSDAGSADREGRRTSADSEP